MFGSQNVYPCSKCYEDKPYFSQDDKGFPVCVDCAEGQECPNCDNEGSTAEHGCGNGGEEACYNLCPIQVQCEFCYTVPDSKFNLNEARIEASAAQNQFFVM